MYNLRIPVRNINIPGLNFTWKSLPTLKSSFGVYFRLKMILALAYRKLPCEGFPPCSVDSISAAQFDG